MAIRYDRTEILRLILDAAQRLPSPASYINKKGTFLNYNGTPLHLACGLQRPEPVLLLLGYGASPVLTNNPDSLTPLDILLQKMQACEDKKEAGQLCLEHLLRFIPEPRFQMVVALLERPEFWMPLLGEEMFGYLVGRVPASLYQRALQTVLHCLPPARFFQSIQELPLPHALKQELTN
uniref:Zgc:112001 n=1 Tax=Latimeria chalumnae TaxID=7897 RepID=M3XKB4_LATCH